MAVTNCFVACHICHRQVVDTKKIKNYQVASEIFNRFCKRCRHRCQNIVLIVVELYVHAHKSVSKFPCCFRQTKMSIACLKNSNWRWTSACAPLGCTCSWNWQLKLRMSCRPFTSFFSFISKERWKHQTEVGRNSFRPGEAYLFQFQGNDWRKPFFVSLVCFVSALFFMLTLLVISAGVSRCDRFQYLVHFCSFTHNDSQ